MFPTAFWKPAGSVYDPAVLSLTGWWRPNYGGSPWAGTASAGSSGSRNLAEGTNAPSAGTALNGYTPADFDGTNDKLALSGGLYLDTLMGAATGSFWFAVLVRMDTLAADAGAINNPILFGDADNVNMGLSISDGGAFAFMYDTTTGYASTSTACTASAYHLIQVWHDGTNLNLMVDQTAATPTAIPLTWFDTYSSGMPATVGTNTYAGKFIDGRIAEVLTMASDPGSTVRTNVRSYINSRYALSL
jgi:hypothetical protein